jgi:hypothetical protein
MRCLKCGNEVSDSAKFCSNCGAPIQPKVQGETAASLSAVPAPVSPVRHDPAQEASPPPKTFISVVIQRVKKEIRDAPKTVVTILVILVIGKILEFFWEGFRGFLEQADGFVDDGVRHGQPFHFYAEFYRHFRHDAFVVPNGNLGTIIGAVFSGFFGAIGQIAHEGPAAIITMAIVLFVGITLTYDRSNDHPIMVALVVGPLVGGIFLYIVMLVMWIVGAVVGIGGKFLTFICSMFPWAKEGAGVFVESKKEKLAEQVVERYGKK